MSWNYIWEEVNTYNHGSSYRHNDYDRAVSSVCRYQWPLGLRRRSAAASLLRLWVRIPPGSWIYVCCECCVLSGKRSLRRADHSSRGVLPTVVCRCVWSRNFVNEEARAHWGAIASRGEKYHLYQAGADKLPRKEFIFLIAFFFFYFRLRIFGQIKRKNWRKLHVMKLNNSPNLNFLCLLTF